MSWAVRAVLKVKAGKHVAQVWLQCVVAACGCSVLLQCVVAVCCYSVLLQCAGKHVAHDLGCVVAVCR